MNYQIVGHRRNRTNGGAPGDERLLLQSIAVERTDKLLTQSIGTDRD